MLIDKVNKHMKNFKEAAGENQDNQLIVNKRWEKSENLEVVNSSSSEYEFKKILIK